jgi:hypothetical protein
LGPLILYWQTFTNKYGFVADDLLVMGKWGCRPFRDMIGQFFHLSEGLYYRPLHHLFGWFQTQVGGSARWVHAGVDFVVHLAAVWALYCAAARLSRSRVAGILAAALWSASSVHLNAFLAPPCHVPERIRAFTVALALALFLSKRWKWTPLALACGANGPTNRG